MREYVKVLFTLFDINNDGMITFEELCAGLKHFNVNLSAQEKKALMNKFDFNRDGEISE